MSKLIDADVAKNCIEVKQEGTLSKWQEGYLAASMSAVHQIELLPDASEPLLKRIVELEGIIHKWEEIGKRLADNWTDVEMDKIIDDANALTGAQDA